MVHTEEGRVPLWRRLFINRDYGLLFLGRLQARIGLYLGNVGLRTMIMFALVLNFMANPLFSVVFPYFGKGILQMEASHYGFTQSSFPAGLMIGTFLVGALTQRINKHQLLSWGIIEQGILVLLMSIIAFPAVHLNLSPMAILANITAPMLFLGLLNVQVNVPLNVMLQESVPDNYRGRVFGLLGSLVQMLVPVSMALFGVLVDIIPTGLFPCHLWNRYRCAWGSDRKVLQYRNSIRTARNGIWLPFDLALPHSTQLF